MPPRRAAAAAAITALGLAAGLVPGPARGQQIHTHTFAGKHVALARGDANVRADEKDHDVSAQSFHSQPSSEHLALTFLDPPTGDAAFVHYEYKLPGPAPVSPLLSAGVWVKATKPGVQLRARVVFPKEPDPARPEAPLTMLVVGKAYDRPRQWDKLTLTDFPELLGKHLPALQAKINRPVNTADAYVDRLVLNVYTGPGPVDVWVDDLDVGPIPRTNPQPSSDAAPGVPTAQGNGKAPEAAPPGPGRLVEMKGGQLLVDGKPHFFRAVRHTGVPLHVLRAAGFDAVWLPPDAAADTVADANREGWFVIPSAPAGGGTSTVSAVPGESPFDAVRRKFAGSDILFWDLGGGLTDDREREVHDTAALLRKADRRRPLGGDLWDGYGAYGQYLDVVGAHRWPLFTSLEVPNYRDWLAQRRQLVGGRPVFWTWVQNHVPDWYTANLKGGPGGLAETAGPHPEQVRQLAYISIAAGCRGLGFWSDKALAESAGGADRLQGMALLNAELYLLGPLLTSAAAGGSGVAVLNTSHEHVKGYLIDANAGRQKGTMLLLVWAGPGDQYVPAQAAVSGLKVMVPTVADGYDPWLVTPAGVECLRPGMRRVPGGVELTVPEFDGVAPVVFTDDVGPTGVVSWWQDRTREFGRKAARWAIDQAKAEHDKVVAVHRELAARGVTVRGDRDLLGETARYYEDARKLYENGQYDRAYKDAARALRPLRVLMRDHWRLAVQGLDVPTASPFAVSYYTLPRHWDLAREVGPRPTWGPSALPHGDFEFRGTIPAGGIPADRIPGWGARASDLPADRVEVGAGVVPAGKLADPAVNRQRPEPPRTLFSPSRPIAPADAGYVPPAPELGQGVLKLHVRPRPLTDRSGKVVGAGAPLERTFLAVDAPPVRFPPGTLVRVSGWVKVPSRLGGTADGALLYDDAGGEPLGVRVLHTGGWKKYHLYRRVPASGQIAVTVALTGTGEAYFDDLRVEPLVPGGGADEAGAEAARRGPAPGPRPQASGVIPASYQPWPNGPQQ